jgi:hypothetical protein
MALSASTIVRHKKTNDVVAVCLICGGGSHGKSFGIYDIFVDPQYREQELASAMIERALSVLSDVCSHVGVEVDDSSPEVAMYKRVGFRFVDDKMEPHTWRQEIERIAAHLGLSRPHNIASGVGGTNYVFLVDGGYLFKFYKIGDDPVWFERETELLHILDRHGVKHSAFYGQGTTFDPPGHLYFVKELVPGIAWTHAHGQISMDEKIRIASDLGTDVAHFHSIEHGGLKHYDLSRDYNRSLIGKHIARKRQRWAERNPDAAAALTGYVEEMVGHFDQLSPILANNDIYSAHVLVVQDGDGFSYSGFIDFGDADCGELEYEMVKIHTQLFDCTPALTNAFLAAYRSIRPVFVSLAKCKVYTLLHRFGNYEDTILSQCRKNDSSALSACISDSLNRIWDGLDVLGED